MAFDVGQFRAELVRDGARPNLFEVSLTFPGAITGATDASLANRLVSFRGRTSQLPGSTMGQVVTTYFGREVKLPGNRTFPEWSITLIEDEDFALRNAFEKWMDALNTHQSNIRIPNAVNSADYSVNADVIQYGKAGDVIKTYRFIGLFPMDITPIDLDWGDNDRVAEYTVTFAYQWWESGTSTGLLG